MNVELFKKEGYIVIENFISKEDVQIIKDICYSIKQSIIQNNLIGKEKDFGIPIYWRGVEMASTQSPILYKYYTSQKMYDISSQLLETDDVYLFNDQIVVKLPHEEFNFSIHTDNSLGPNNDMALNGKFKTITSCLVLDDFGWGKKIANIKPTTNITIGYTKYFLFISVDLLSMFYTVLSPQYKSTIAISRSAIFLFQRFFFRRYSIPHFLHSSFCPSVMVY